MTDQTKLEADFLAVAKLPLFIRYVDCTGMAEWNPAQWHEAVSQAARAWDADGRPQTSLLNRCVCGRVISDNKLSCKACKDAATAPAPVVS